MLKKFLNDIIAKHVLGQLDAIVSDLVEDLIFLITVGADQFVLHPTGCHLVTTELQDMAVNVLCTNVSDELFRMTANITDLQLKLLL